jgi:hypothetical protein
MDAAVAMDLRGGSGNLDKGLGGNSPEIGMIAESRRNHGKTTPPEPQPGF